MKPARILVLCTQNSCRSQMAEALIRNRYGARAEVFSAGARPAEQVHPLAVRALAARGIEVHGQKPKSVDAFAGQSFDFVITTCDAARDSCPVFFGPHENLHWGLEDPARAQGSPEEVMSVFAKTADMLEERIAALDEKIEAINRSGD